VSAAQQELETLRNRCVQLETEAGQSQVLLEDCREDLKQEKRHREEVTAEVIFDEYIQRISLFTSLEE
jgi:hypothetical protein